MTIAWARGCKRRSPVGEREIEAAALAALAHGGREMSLSIAIVGDARIANLHERWFGDPTPTDVISFDLGREPGPAGELYVSLECALRVARARGLDAAREMLLYVVHGTLHLCGYDDVEPRDRAAMRRAEARVLAQLAGGPTKPRKSSVARTRRAPRRKKTSTR